MQSICVLADIQLHTVQLSQIIQEGILGFNTKKKITGDLRLGR